MRRYLADLRDGFRILDSRRFCRSFRDYWSPNAVADRVDGWLLAAHEPVDMYDAGPPVCLRHRRPVAWPCDDAVAAMDRRAARSPRQP